MATTEEFKNGGSTSYSFSIEYIKASDIKVKIDGAAQTYTTNASPSSGQYKVVSTTVTLGAAAASGTGNVHIYRETDLDTAAAVFASGSSIRAADLNACHDLVRLSSQEQNQTVRTSDFGDGQITSAKIADGTIVNIDVNASAAIAGTKVSPAFGSQNVSTSGTLAAGATTVTGNIAVSGTVDGRDVATDGSKLDGIEAGATGNQTNAEIRTAVEAASDSNVFTDADHSKLNAIEASATADQTNAEIRTAVEAATDSNVFTDADHSKLNAIEASATADQNAGEIRVLVESASDSNVFTDADHTKLNAIEASADVTDATNVNAAGAVMNSDTTTASMSFVVDEDNFSSNSATKLPTQQSTKAYIAATSQPLDSDLTTLAGMQSGTASILASGTALTSTTAELNLLDGKSVVTAVSGSSTDVQLPTAKAVNDQIVNLLNDTGGFKPIATEVSFPTTNPDPDDGAGTIVSIADAGGLKVADGSGSGTYAGTAGHSIGATTTAGVGVTITDIDTSLRGTTIAAGKGMLVQTTSTLNTYTYHRLIVDEAGVAAAQTLVSDFNQRYRVGSSNPTSSLDDGDLFFNTSSDKMLVYNATSSAWEEVQSVGNYFINTISSYSGTGGNNATFNGSAYRFVLSNPGTYAEQHIVSVNGVIQKPNSGTSQPSEGFAIDGSSIIFSAAPATGSDFFIITIGASVNIGTPSNNTVSTAILQNGSVTTDKLGADAVTGAKIADDAVGAEHIEVLDANLQFGDSVKAQFGAGNDLSIWHNATDNIIEGSQHLIVKTTESAKKIYLQSDTGVDISDVGVSEYQAKFINDGAVELYFDNSKKFETDANGVTITGQCAVTSHVAWPDYSSGYVGKAVFGYGDDLQIWHDGSHSYLQNTTGNFYIQPKSGENAVKIVPDGAVELYYDNSKKLETMSWGVLATGDIQTYDNNKVILGSGSDLQIYHDGTDNIILSSGASCDLLTYVANGELAVKAVANGAVELYYDNAKVFETLEYGARVARPSGGATSLEIVGCEGQDAQLYIAADDGDDNNDKMRLVAGQGSYSLMNYGGGSWETNASFHADAQVELYYNGSKKVETYADGIYVTGVVEAHRSSEKAGIFNRNGSAGTLVTYRFQGTQCGKVSVDTNSTTYATSSDYRLKENQVAISDGITRLKQLKPYKFNWKGIPDKTIDGFFAHEVTPAVPEAITGEKDGTEMQQIDQSKLVPLLTAALQEAITKIETLETKVAALEAK